MRLARAPLCVVVLVSASCGAAEPGSGGTLVEGDDPEGEMIARPSGRWPRHVQPPPVEILVDESGDRPASMGPELTAAVALYDARRVIEAAVELQRIVEGEVAAPPADVMSAQFYLGKALYHGGYPQSAWAVFQEVSYTDTHPHFRAALPWLGHIGQQVPDRDWVTEAVGRYASPEPASPPDWMRWELARFHYRQGEFQDAIRLLEALEPQSPLWLRAAVLRAAAHQRLRRDDRSAIIYQRLAGFDVAAGDEYARRVREHARLSLAQLHFAQGSQSGRYRFGPRAGRALLNALVLFERVDETSPYAGEAALGAAWTAFHLRRQERVRSALSRAPEEFMRSEPEAYVLLAMSALLECRVDLARAQVGRFHADFDATRQDVERFLQSVEDNVAFFEALRPIMEGRRDLGSALSGFTWLVRGNASAARMIALVDWLDEQLAKLEAASAPLADTSLAARILQDLLVARSFAVDQAGDLVRGRVSRWIDELQDTQNQMRDLELELAHVRPEHCEPPSE